MQQEDDGDEYNDDEDEKVEPEDDDDDEPEEDDDDEEYGVPPKKKSKKPIVITSELVEKIDIIYRLLVGRNKLVYESKKTLPMYINSERNNRAEVLFKMDTGLGGEGKLHLIYIYIYNIYIDIYYY